ncbi:MAG: HEAT repeat domain-containing protein [Thermodesulfobacteriota bacterium]
METLHDFCAKDMTEQIGILESLRERRVTEAIPELFALYADRCFDQVVEEMLYHALADLLAGQPSAVAEGLRNPCERVRLLSIRQTRKTRIENGGRLLADLMVGEEDPIMLAEILRALAMYRDPELVERIMPLLQHEDQVVSGLAMKFLAPVANGSVRAILVAMVENTLARAGAGDVCDLRIASALEALASIGGDDLLPLLVRHIHHANPTLRRLVLETIAGFGEDSLPTLAEVLQKGDKDERIMAANIIGQIGARQGADILADVLEQSGDANFKFAVYEALGRIGSLRSIVVLSDGLGETDELALIAVMDSLNRLCNPGVVKVLTTNLAAGGDHARRLAAALITARGTRLFSYLYDKPENAALLLEALRLSRDQEAIAVFIQELIELGDERARRDLESLQCAVTVKNRHVIAADDSKAMLFFYRSVAAELGLHLIACNDGREALDRLGSERKIDFLITDMNMPNMTGIELTMEVRRLPRFAGLPILMATTESDEGQKEAALKAGVDGFISKPFTREQFREKLEKMLRERECP